MADNKPTDDMDAQLDLAIYRSTEAIITSKRLLAEAKNVLAASDKLTGPKWRPKE